VLDVAGDIGAKVVGPKTGQSGKGRTLILFQLGIWYLGAKADPREGVPMRRAAVLLRVFLCVSRASAVKARRRMMWI
jgi:hypothetical protein